jgi:hypothetical protein
LVEKASGVHRVPPSSENGSFACFVIVIEWLDGLDGLDGCLQACMLIFAEKNC